MKSSRLVGVVFLCGGLTAGLQWTGPVPALNRDTPPKPEISLPQRRVRLDTPEAVLLSPQTAAALGATGTVDTVTPASPRLKRTNLLGRIPPIRIPGTAWAALPSAPLKPGIYQTAPQSIIVIVPDGHLDEEALVALPQMSSNDFPMPVIRPDVTFIPRSGGK
jgi:hypothetical protein